MKQSCFERGYTVTFQATYYVFLLFMFVGFIYDLGGLGISVSVASKATRLAAQEAAKKIDYQTFIDTQQIRLNHADAVTAANNTVAGLTAGKVQVTSVTFNGLATRDVVVVHSRATAKLPILGSVFGIAPVTFDVEAYGEPAFGIASEGQ